MHFPQYRKYKNGASVFRIEGPDRFVELQRIGRKVVRHEIQADRFPEMQTIQDMLMMEQGRWELATEYEFLMLAQLVRKF